MATLKDIGDELGLSTATVSRALNGFPEVNAATRTRVVEVATRLGYRPNRIAQRLVTGRSGMVGMIVKVNPDMSTDRNFLETLTGLTAALAQRDVELVLSVDQHDNPIAAYQRILERGILDGFILNAPQLNDPRIEFLRQRGIPFAVHGVVPGDTDYPYYAVNNHGIAKVSVDFLLSLGHRRIAYLNGERGHVYAEERAAGFAKVMQAEGLGVPDAFHTFLEPVENEGYLSAINMLSGRAGPRPTAIICSSVVLAVGAMRAAKDLGLNVPSDLSIIAHDDDLPDMRSDTLVPQLTVTMSPLRDACVPLANHLIDRITSGPTVVPQTVAEARLVVRASTATVPLGHSDPW